MKLTLKNDYLIWQENGSKEIIIDYRDKMTLSIEVFNHATPQKNSNYIQEVLIIDQYERKFEIKNIVLPNFEIKE